MSATTTFVALTEPAEVAEANPIHGDTVAAQVGYQGALVSGVHTYAWATEAAVAGLGEAWLDRGWADIWLRRPLYEGERITTIVEDDGRLTTAKDDGTIVLEGTVGLGDAPFLADMNLPSRRAPEPEPAELGYLLLDTAPVGEDFRPMSVPGAESPAWSKTRLNEQPGSRYLGERPRLNPGWLASRMTALVRHSYHYGPAIHARTRMAHLAPGYAEGNITVSARLQRVYERKGHHYHESHCVVTDTNGVDVACFIHDGIFRIAGYDYGY